MHMRLQLPQGASCFTFGEARARRAIEARVVSVFDGWGYDEIVPPLFDDAATFDPTLASKLYTFSGRDGTTLALRPDFTSLVAKIAAGRLRQVEAPLRLYYSGEVVRYEPPRAGRQSEFHQMGLEFLGGGGPAADVEVIAVAIECMEAAGVEDFVLALGHAGVVTALLDAAGLPVDDSGRDEALASLNRRDPIAVARALEGARGSGPARRALVGLAEDNGIRQSLDAARIACNGIESVGEALSDLESLTRTLDEAGLGARVAIDLSESRGLDYYTGLVFRIYGGGLGFDVGGGGRYDALLGRLGRPLPAIGFMLGLDRLALLVDRSGSRSPEPAVSPVVVNARTLGESVREARERRRRRERIRFEGPA
ncbi:MAG: ATP phosphoribosyltransferase regulatory subunit [Vicinamibacteria bacterium]|nr:ATP phosphoribosyltransferase regulatory subunit [Vicinamibacteria bacterium]